ncbi:MAG: GntR family transcriptional regulator [Acetatifactor sp.]|nr:GntR family transcriptional regulator [Acetatifactor sp.]
MILLDYRDKRPIYEQVVEKLERLIASGGLEPLTKMPSVRSLAVELSVNPNTVQRAYTQLEQDGYLYTVSGRGSFVTAESEWKNNRQNKVLTEWEEMTRQARETGLAQETLAESLRRIYGENMDNLPTDDTENVGKGGSHD